MHEALRVLVVEDEAVILMLLEAVVEDEGHEVVGTAMASSDAIRLIEMTRPDLVLLDLNLVDGASGVRVAQSAQEAGADIVFMTANPSQAEGFDGAMGTLAKPFSRFTFSATLRYVAECIQAPPPKTSRPSEFVTATKLAGSLRPFA